MADTSKVTLGDFARTVADAIRAERAATARALAERDAEIQRLRERAERTDATLDALIAGQRDIQHTHDRIHARVAGLEFTVGNRGPRKVA